MALAVVRLHALGHAMGFLRDARKRPLPLPSLYLVDQDSGDGSTHKTAWQLVRESLGTHPGRRDWRATAGRPKAPDPKIITPLPVGRDREWFRPPRDSFDGRFGGSRWLDILLSRPQQEIRFSRGMMGSPAVGSLLLRLKGFDEDEAGTNHDGDYRTLLNESGRIAIVGSAIGGTGASVTPTLARQLAKGHASVMAIMVMNWFRFDLAGLDEETSTKANRRNRSMEENANSAFAHFGDSLAREVATVPVGMPSRAAEPRQYTSDTQQPILESFIHGVAALCALHHFLDDTPPHPGLYQMGAEDRRRLGGGTLLPGASDTTLQDLSDRAEQLACTAEDAATALSSSFSTGWRRRFQVRPPIHGAMKDFGDAAAIAHELRRAVEEFRTHIVWMKDVLDVEPTRAPAGWRPDQWGRHLQQSPLMPKAGRVSPEEAALELFHWMASRLGEEGTRGNTPAAAAGGYWPPLVGTESLSVTSGQAGELVRIPDQNVHATVEGFVASDKVSENGWPHPLAAMDQFRYAIEQRNQTALRQLEMLVAGIMTEKLKLRRVPSTRQDAALTLDSVLAEAREEHGRDFARFRIVMKQPGGEVVLGFSSPHTLLCPTPWAEDLVRKRAWRQLWQQLTDSETRANWRTSSASKWGYIRSEIRQIRMWIESEKRVHDGVAPPWTRIFQHESANPTVPPGWGTKLSVLWGSGNGARRIRLALPTRTPGNYWPAKNTERISNDEFLQRTPDLRKTRTRAGISFELVEFDVAGSKNAVRGIWRKHLEDLQKRGKIAAFGWRPERRQVALLSADRRRATVIEEVELLRRESIMTREFVPMRQGPVPGSAAEDGDLRHPDLPLRSRYLGLVKTAGGASVFDLLRKGESCSLPQPTLKGQGAHRAATWELRLAGRSDIVPIKLPLPAEPHRAHWMVWPRFRAAGELEAWRAYYIYEHCSDSRLHLRVLWLDPATGRAQVATDLTRQGSNPVRFRTGDLRAHTGGPPLAMSLENDRSKKELGIYVVGLESLGQQDRSVEIGIDFGTSHTVAASRVDGQTSLVELTPEFASPSTSVAGGGGGMTLHLSEDWAHVNAGFENDGLRDTGIWMPTYSDDHVPPDGARGLLPSELLTISPLSSLKAKNASDWVPGRDCVIPYMNMRRNDLAGHLLFDFKWSSSSASFRGSESVLREIYLGMVLEFVAAEIVWHHLEGVPRQAALTFSYPLRTSNGELSDFRATLSRILRAGSESLGIELQLVDNVGIYNESRAAKGGTERFGEVCLVGDLGGGTLDLFISANSAPGIEFDEVSDSAKIGGNELLGLMAGHPDRFLPKAQEWRRAPDEIETKLRAWMRSMGAPQLFGDGAGTPQQHSHLNLKGFARAVDGKPARELIERYFRLVTEYMARSLVAFLVGHWYPAVLRGQRDPSPLRILVQLRGNGWRLWPDRATYAEIQRRVSADITGRVRELWSDRAGERDVWDGQEDLWREHRLWIEPDGVAAQAPPIGAPRCAPEGSWEPNPKAAPILSVVGEALDPEKIRSYSHALTQLTLLHDDRRKGKDSRRPRPSSIRWFDRLPVRTGGSGARVEMHEVDPPLRLSHPDATRKWEIADLEPELKREVNRQLRELGATVEVDYRAPIAAFVWENAFRSRRFRGEE